VSEVGVYWLIDFAKNHKCSPPAVWKVLYKAGSEWKEVELDPGQSYGLNPNQYNTVKFRQVETTAIRIQAKLKWLTSSGILRLRIK
jgi:hypothetical protein